MRQVEESRSAAATMTELAALPFEMANAGLIGFFCLVETLLPAMRPGPIVSKIK